MALKRLLIDLLISAGHALAYISCCAVVLAVFLRVTA
jgi:hypothetical protein